MTHVDTCTYEIGEGYFLGEALTLLEERLPNGVAVVAQALADARKVQ